jgi:hypothetical protein
MPHTYTFNKKQLKVKKSAKTTLMIFPVSFHAPLPRTNVGLGAVCTTTLSIMTFSIIALSIITFSITTFSITTFSIMTLSIMINKTLHKA